MKKVVFSLLFIAAFFSNSISTASAVDVDAGESSLGRYASRSLKDYPTLFDAHQTPYFESYWNFQRCQGGPCGNFAPEMRLTAEARQKLIEAQNFVEQVLLKKFQEFDQWALKRLPFWKQRRHEVFPVTILLEPFPENSMVPSAAVVIQEFKYEDNRGTSRKRERRPTIYVDVSSDKSAWTIYSPVLTHEFGHALLYSLGLPQYLSALDETFADMLMLTFHPGSSAFLPEFVPSTRKNLIQGLSESVDEDSRQFFQETLRIMSDNGIRDFSKKDNPRFPEIYLYPELYFISSMVNTTFHRMSTRVSMERWTEAFLTLVQANPNILLEFDLSAIMSAALKEYQTKYPQEFQNNKSLIKEVLSAQKWQHLREISTKMELRESGPNAQKRTIFFDLPIEQIPAIDQKKATFLLQLFGGKKVIGHAACMFPEQCKKIKFILNSQNSCMNSPCTCFSKPVSVEAQFLYLGTDGKIRKSKKSGEAVPSLRAGCYWVSSEEEK